MHVSEVTFSSVAVPLGIYGYTVQYCRDNRTPGRSIDKASLSPKYQV